MQQKLINHSPDLLRLQDEGFDLEISGGQHLQVHHIPFLNSKLEIKYGTLVCVLTLVSPTRIAPPQDHTAYFCGEIPCDIDGQPLTAIINNSTNQQLSESILVNHFFSSRPLSGNYTNYYDKIRTYSEILCCQAKAMDNTVSPKKHKKIQDENK